MFDKINGLHKELKEQYKIARKAQSDYEKDKNNIMALKALYYARGKITILEMILY